MSLSRLYLRTRLDIFNVFLKYRRYTLIRSFPLTSVFPTSPSAIFNFYHLAFVNVPSYSVYLLLILLGSLSVPPRSIHLSQCRLLCPCVSYYADVCVTVLDTSFISSSSFRLLAVSAVFPLQLFNTYVEFVLSMPIYSVPAFAFSSFTFFPFIPLSPTSRQRLDVHLSLTSGWVHLAWTHVGFRRCASIYIGSVLIVSLRPLLLASGGEPSIMRHSILVLVPRFQLLVFRFLVSRSSLSVTRFHLLVFRFRVPRSSLSVRYHGVIVAVDLYVFLVFYSFVYSFVSWLLSLFVPPSRRHDVHLLLISRMGSLGPELVPESDGVPPL